MIKILYTSHTPNMNMGGQISLYNLVKRLDRKKYHPTLICPSPGPLSRAFTEIKCNVVYQSFPRFKLSNSASICKSFMKIFLFLKTQKFHIIHSDHPTDTFYLASCAKLLQIPLIWHGRVTFKSRLDFFNLKLATKVIGVSKAVSFRFQTRKGIPDKYVTIYNGVDHNEFRPRKTLGVCKEFGFESGENIITTIGQIKPDKGIYDFLSSAKLISEKTAKCRFLIVGEGDASVFAHLMGKISEYGLQKSVQCLGFRKDIPKILNQTDVFVLASFPYVEGLPRVVIEAMACARPVVGTDVHGINEVVEDGVTGFLVPSKNPQKLAQAIFSLLNDTRKAKIFGDAARASVINSFSIESNVSKIQNVYEQIITGLY